MTPSSDAPAKAPRSGRLRRAARFATLVALMVAAWLAVGRALPVLRHPLVIVSLARQGAAANLPVPVQGVRERDLRDTWGAARSGGRTHQGIDIFAPRGTPVLSATRGIVVTVGVNSLGGRIVRVLGPGLEWHYYAHLDAHGDVAPGDVVAAGAVLGFVGDSGNARGTPPHLHYGIYGTGGGATNPFPRLKRPSSGPSPPA